MSNKYIRPPTTPDAFKSWMEELTSSAREQPHCLLLVGEEAQTLIRGHWCPPQLQEPWTRRREYDHYSTELWQPQALEANRDYHMLIIHIDVVCRLAADSKMIQNALGTIRAIVFLAPSSDSNTDSIKVLGIGRGLRPCFYVVLPTDMCKMSSKTGFVEAEGVVAVAASARGASLAQLRWELSQVNAFRRSLARRCSENGV